MFLFYFCQYSVIVFFNCALVGAAMIRLRRRRSDAGRRFRCGQGAPACDPRLCRDRRDGRRGAQALEGRRQLPRAPARQRPGRGLDAGDLPGRAGAGQPGGGPVDALKQSVRLLKRTWGENAIGNVGIGMAFGFLIMFVGDRWSACCWPTSPRRSRWGWRSWSGWCSSVARAAVGRVSGGAERHLFGGAVSLCHAGRSARGVPGPAVGTRVPDEVTAAPCGRIGTPVRPPQASSKRPPSRCSTCPVQ